MPKRTDPVCGMELDPGQVDAQSSYQGKEYDFCSDECRRLFDADPEQYVGTTPDEPSNPEPPPVPQ
jgi:Cu+-exporting ATPase